MVDEVAVKTFGNTDLGYSYVTAIIVNEIIKCVRTKLFPSKAEHILVAALVSG